MLCITAYSSMSVFSRPAVLFRGFHKVKKITKKKKAVTNCDRAMEHFDDFYGNYYGEKWQPMREALLRKKKFAALVNNFGDSSETIARLENRGAHNMRNLFRIQKQFDIEHNIVIEEAQSTVNVPKKLDAIAAKMGQSELSKLYPNVAVVPEYMEKGDAVIRSKPLEEDVEAEEDTEGEEGEAEVENDGEIASKLSMAAAKEKIDPSRIILPMDGFDTTTSLYQHIPATKLYGRDDWIPESTHYQYYSSSSDFPLIIEEDEELVFPQHLQVYAFEDANKTTFFEPARSKTGVVNYYLLDGASILPVLALNLRGGEHVLDMCAAPGGKSLAILQTLLPEKLHANDLSISRTNRLRRIFTDYLIDFDSPKWQDRVQISSMDAFWLENRNAYDRILLDAPCTTDRISVTEEDNNIFRPNRIKERLKIPELQAHLLRTALNLVKVGGVVVYATCSLSPIQNDGVVHMGLKLAFEKYGITAVIKNMTKCMQPARSFFRFGSDNIRPKYGQLVTPHEDSNFGPSYFAKLVRTK